MIYEFCWMSFTHGLCVGVVTATLMCIAAAIVDEIRNERKDR